MKQYRLILILALLAGFIGGVVSNQFLSAQTVSAQNEVTKKIIEANEFRVIDTEGKVVAVLGQEYVEKDGYMPILRLSNKENPPFCVITTSGIIMKK